VAVTAAASISTAFIQRENKAILMQLNGGAVMQPEKQRNSHHEPALFSLDFSA
jgi:hypothetical protein